jgi:hypothetical protein
MRPFRVLGTAVAVLVALFLPFAIVFRLLFS